MHTARCRPSTKSRDADRRDGQRRRHARRCIGPIGISYMNAARRQWPRKIGAARALPLMGWPGRAHRPKTTVEQDGEASKLKELTMHTHQRSSDAIATIGLDIGKTTFHLVGLDKRGA